MSDYKKHSDELYRQLIDGKVFRELDEKDQILAKSLIRTTIMEAIHETEDDCKNAHEKYKRNDINSGPIITRD